MKPDLEISVAATKEKAQELAEEGFLVVPDWRKNGRPMFTAMGCYREDFGKMSANPRFVVVGKPTEDATLAIAALAGLIPYQRDFPIDLTGELCGNERVASAVVWLVNRLSSGDIRSLIHEGRAGSIVLAWRCRQDRRREPMWAEAIHDWSQLITGKDSMSDVAGEIAAAREAACSTA